MNEKKSDWHVYSAGEFSNFCFPSPPPNKYRRDLNETDYMIWRALLRHIAGAMGNEAIRVAGETGGGMKKNRYFTAPFFTHYLLEKRIRIYPEKFAPAMEDFLKRNSFEYKIEPLFPAGAPVVIEEIARRGRYFMAGEISDIIGLKDKIYSLYAPGVNLKEGTAVVSIAEWTLSEYFAGTWARLVFRRGAWRVESIGI